MNKQELDRAIDEVWALFKETDERFKETDKRLDKRIEETDKRLDKRFKETEEGFRETKEMFEETDRRLDERFEETDRRFKETAKDIKKLTKNIGGLSGKWGKFVEGIVAPGAVRMFKVRGIDVNLISTRIKAQRNGKDMEIDVLVVNQEYVLAIEAKSTLSVEEVNKHLKRLKDFKKFFPHFKDKKVIGAVAGIVIEEEADRYAYHKGLFVIGQTGETVKILNDEKFKPKVW